MNVNHKKEILFYYESRKNPNGDPGFDDQPRLMDDGTIMVTDLRLKRTIRDYARDHLKKTLLVDYNEKGSPVSALVKTKELLGATANGDLTEKLLKKCFDSNLFGHFVPVEKDEQKKYANNAWFKLTGPVQIGLGASVNEPRNCL